MDHFSKEFSPYKLISSTSKIKSLIAENSELLFFSKKLNFVRELGGQIKLSLSSFFREELSFWAQKLFSASVDGYKDAEIMKLQAIQNVLKNKFSGQNILNGSNSLDFRVGSREESGVC